MFFTSYDFKKSLMLFHHTYVNVFFRSGLVHYLQGLSKTVADATIQGKSNIFTFIFISNAKKSSFEMGLSLPISLYQPQMALPVPHD